MALRILNPPWEQERMVREVVKRCGEFVSTYRSTRDLKSYYDKGWVALVLDGDDIVGFWLIRHGTRNGWTTIHEIGVVPEFQRQGYGAAMIVWLLTTSPHRRLRLVCDARNTSGLEFYKDQGFWSRGARQNRSGDTIIDLEVCL